jgi:hypothetical protein
MGNQLTRKQMRAAAPDWIFRWSRLEPPALPKWFALLLVGAAFAILLTSVRIRVIPPTPWAVRKASVIDATNESAVSRILTLRAREGGPFPSRLEPSEWEGAAAIENAVLAASRWSPPPYTPKLKDLPETTPLTSIQLATQGEREFPKRSLMPEPRPAVAPKPGIALYLLAGIRQDEIPTELPEFGGQVDESMTADRWRFLVRLHPSGTVIDCVSLAGSDADAAHSHELATWLRSIRFQPTPDETARWIAVGIGFTNQPAHGTESR